jgi:4-hydroxybenzoate polyprenyltransferase
MELALNQKTFFKKVRYSFELVKFSHTLFALPFALAAFFVSSRGKFHWRTLLWVIVCVLLARTAAMAFNRLADAATDAKNPRTQNRHLPAGLLSRKFVVALILISSTGFIYAASRLNPLAFKLSPICLFILFFYSFTKRFTHFTQFFLGLSLGMAPVGAAIAATGHWSHSAFLLGNAVLFWVAGFDLLYALQDLDFDKSAGLFSLPVRLGITKTFRLSALLHLFFVAILLAYGIIEHLGLFYWVGLCITGALLIWEHWLLKEDLKKLQSAFFTANGLLSLIFLIFVSLDVFFP